MDLGNPIAKGNTADIYLCDKKIIKVLKDYLPETEAIKEADKQRLAWKAGLPVPEILDVIKIENRQAVVMEYITGDTLGNMMLKDISHAAGYMRIAVKTQIKIHTVKGDGYPLMKDKLASQISSAPLPDAASKESLLEKLYMMKYEERICHGDFHVHNIIMHGKEPYIIDWVDASSGDISADVCRSYLLYSQISTELAKLYINLYCEATETNQDKVLAWASVIAGARLAENVSSENPDRLLRIINGGLKNNR